MSKTHKKRHKSYQGRDAVRGPVVHRYVAEAKSPQREWWDDHRRAIKLGAGIAGAVIIVGWLLYELILLIF